MSKKVVFIPATEEPQEPHRSPMEDLNKEIRNHDIQVQIEAYEGMIRYCQEQIDALKAEMEPPDGS